jgi:hypothetical protein
LISLDTLRSELKRAGAESVEAIGKIVEEKLQAFHQAVMIQLKTELRRATQKTRRDFIDPRKKFIAEIIKSRKPYPRMSLSDILTEADKRQHLFPTIAHYRPVPTWKVAFWTAMKGKNKAQKYISKIRADPRYLPLDYLTTRGRERL